MTQLYKSLRHIHHLHMIYYLYMNEQSEKNIRCIKILLKIIVLLFIIGFTATAYVYCKDIRPLLQNLDTAITTTTSDLHETAIQTQETLNKIDEASIQTKGTAEEINRPVETVNSLLNLVPGI